MVEDELATPPSAPAPGDAWLVAVTPTGAFTGHAAAIAGWTSAGWRFLEPQVGFRVFDKTANCFRHFDGSWRRAIAPAAPSGGATIDAEARTALADIREKLVDAGIFATS